MMIIKKNILISTSHLFPDVRVREDSAALARLHKKVEEGKSLLFADCCLGGGSRNGGNIFSPQKSESNTKNDS